jgi:hypothetical protein
MGRTFLSVRQGARIIAERWERAARRTGHAKQAQGMYELAKKYASEGFMGCNEPLESVLFSACVELQKERK